MASSSSKTEDRPLPEQVVVGRVVRPHGVRGEVVVEPLTDLASRYDAGRRLGCRAGSARRVLTVSRSRPGTAGLIVAFAEIGDREAAEALRGGELEVDRAEVPPAKAGEYYYYELVGARCVDEREGELGRVVDLAEGPAGLLLWVEDETGRRLPLPFVERFVAGVDRAARRIDWRLPEGLIAACASRS
jgi:16S rRNA processing protein RimM